LPELSRALRLEPEIVDEFRLSAVGDRRAAAFARAFLDFISRGNYLSVKN